MKTTKSKHPYVIIRATNAGVFFGKLVKKTGDEVILHDARRIWQWAGAASLSQLAAEGTKNPAGCKFPQPVSEITILGVIEIIATTPEAQASINSVNPWKQ
jgi:hypothetical protein